jgi:hypothetical protein
VLELSAVSVLEELLPDVPPLEELPDVASPEADLLLAAASPEDDPVVDELCRLWRVSAGSWPEASWT